MKPRVQAAAARGQGRGAAVHVAVFHGADLLRAVYFEGGDGEQRHVDATRQPLVLASGGQRGALAGAGPHGHAVFVDDGGDHSQRREGAKGSNQRAPGIVHVAALALLAHIACARYRRHQDGVAGVAGAESEGQAVHHVRASGVEHGQSRAVERYAEAHRPEVVRGDVEKLLYVRDG